MPWLFSYGTLQEPRVQRDTFGRLLDGRPDVLAGFARGQVPIAEPAQQTASGRTHYDNVVPTGRPTDRVAGLALDVTDAELLQADEYERDADYGRQEVTLESGRRAWVYRARHAS
ncbi:MAG: gamma-glutamylcyclotransferase family protein [Vicinamibacterales bacterium]